MSGVTSKAQHSRKEKGRATAIGAQASGRVSGEIEGVSEAEEQRRRGAAGGFVGFVRATLVWASTFLPRSVPSPAAPAGHDAGSEICTISPFWPAAGDGRRLERLSRRRE